MFKNVSIYIATNKEIQLPNYSIYKPILLGNDLRIDGYLKDNIGENIATKNNSFCELTALYWIWKNCNDDILGLVHYRRFLCKKEKDQYDLLSAKYIKKVLKKQDIIVSHEIDFGSFSVREQYSHCHHEKDYDKCRSVVKDIFPSYLNDFDKVSSNNKLRICNMMITNKNILNEYCSFLFPILFLLEEQIDTTDYDDYNKRVFGFLAERLFNVWLANKINQGLTFREEDACIINSKKLELIKQ